jgi:hypothetical protein
VEEELQLGIAGFLEFVSNKLSEPFRIYLEL